jgi:hypothetical protein
LTLAGDWAAVGATAALFATTEHNSSENRAEVNREDLDAAIEGMCRFVVVILVAEAVLLTTFYVILVNSW